MKRETKLLLVPCLIALVGLGFLAPRGGFVTLVIAAGVPDAWGNHIDHILVFQYSNVSSSWVLRDNVTEAEYTSGIDVNINPDEDIRFFVRVWTRVVNNAGEALAYTRCYVTVTGQLSITLMTGLNASAGYDYGLDESGFYIWHYYQWNGTSGVPFAGVTYQTTIQYQVYFDPDAWDQLE